MYEDVLASDPFLLAAPGQAWALRPEATGPAPGLLLIIDRDSDQITVEDEHGQRHQIPLHALHTYRLDQWCWARPDTTARHHRPVVSAVSAPFGARLMLTLGPPPAVTPVATWELRRLRTRHGITLRDALRR
ncbi:hypothetical protein SSPS47_00295 [Streptomyces sp. S4.7]|uniref:hypothetical protein n=1 Tax=Streptomyces sp. S4.7 TaxID=2705439 RepID=UPI001396FE5C|nr:hypothetical protein [Streptomyces sp. S4.7]QHY93569.1 hypothetical protein SSPS47_00295 [Streptomyces sp. S4.7]